MYAHVITCGGQAMTSAKTYSTKELSGTRVVGGKHGDARLGKVDRFVFHPSSKRCVGFTVKRPDLALMFRRKDLFVPLDGFSVEDGRIALPYKEKEMEGKGALERLGLDWDACILWEGMPIITESGTECGTVGDIIFDRVTGKIESVAADKGSTSRALLGEKVIPASMIRGFKLGIGVELATDDDDDDSIQYGAILVDDSVIGLRTEGGIAEAAGQQAAVAQHKVRTTAAKAKPKVEKATKAAEDASIKGAFVTGRQLGRAKGMFSAFKNEYDKAVADDKSGSKKK